MPRIINLSENLINQIAAGEMIDRPASIIKELLENSIDANAKNINVYFSAGGIKEIIIQDDGEGIEKEDLELAITRHATSKISKFDDLQNVSTLGFRGEALASIASAAQLQIITSTNGKNAYMISAENGKFSEITPANREKGTTTIVRDLFFNIPARRHFLKKEITEANHCLETCLRLALINPQIAFKVNNNSKICLQVNTETFESRIKSLLGNELFNISRKVDEKTLDNNQEFSINGLLALPSSVSSNKDQQYLFVNSRYIRDRIIYHAIREGYGEMRHDAKNLAYVIKIEVPPTELDVNVSPQKTEVRFRNSQMLHSFVAKSVRKSLSGIPGQYPTPTISLEKIAQNNKYSHEENHYSQTFRNSKSNEFRTSSAASFTSRQVSLANKLLDTNLIDNAIEIFKQNPKLDENSVELENFNYSHPLGYAIGTLHNLYILAQNQQGLVIVEIHAAHERLIFEKLKQQKSGQINCQNLMVPWQIILNSNQISTFTEYQDFLSEFGIYAEIKNQYLEVIALPIEIKNANIQLLISEILHDLEEYGNSQALQELREQILSTIACHGARRGQQTMTLEQMNQLLREMEIIERSGSCNHGRPTYAVIPLIDIDKFFMRGK